MKRGVDLDACCIEDVNIWDKVYSEGPQEYMGFEARELKRSLENHIRPSTDMDTGRFTRAASINSDFITSTLSTESWSAMDQEGITESTED
jgi:hypothetical protein